MALMTLTYYLYAMGSVNLWWASRPFRQALTQVRIKQVKHLIILIIIIIMLIIKHLIILIMLISSSSSHHSHLIIIMLIIIIILIIIMPSHHHHAFSSAMPSHRPSHRIAVCPALPAPRSLITMGRLFH